MGGTIGFFIAVSIVSAIIFVLTTRADRIRDRRRAYADSSAGESGSTTGTGGFSLLDWFSGTSPSSSSDDSCNSSSSSFFGSSDSSCGGGDGGGGGGD